MAGHSMTSTAAPVGQQQHIFGFTKAQFIALCVMFAALIVAPFFLYPVFLMKLLCFALFACAFNLLIGYVGLTSFGHAAYFGMGGYTTSLGYRTDDYKLVAFILSATLALAQMIYFFCLQAPFTGGEDGIQAVPRGNLFGVISLANDMTMYWFVAAVFVICFLLIHRIVHSPFGQVLKAIRENEPRTTSLGYRTDDYKLVAFILSATLAGVAGGTKSLVFGIATLTDVHWSMSGEVLLMTLVGGLGTVFGPMIGAAVIVAMQNYLAEMGAWVTVIQGFIFIACVLAFRRGIVGEIANLLRVRL
ncbi:MAG: branched-chain amino acid ABC transporter permease [Acetobacteraceae bacterium]|nr:branched-chain amino acid ABC transporter permease [Acetobacteraceae bacterium]